MQLTHTFTALAVFVLALGRVGNATPLAAVSFPYSLHVVYPS